MQMMEEPVALAEFFSCTLGCIFAVFLSLLTHELWLARATLPVLLQAPGFLLNATRFCFTIGCHSSMTAVLCLIAPMSSAALIFSTLCLVQLLHQMSCLLDCLQLKVLSALNAGWKKWQKHLSFCPCCLLLMRMHLLRAKFCCCRHAMLTMMIQSSEAMVLFWIWDW